MTILSEKAKRFLKRNPTKIGTVDGHKFYEHPDYGDEHHLIMITPEGKLKVSCHYELPESGEIY